MRSFHAYVCKCNQPKPHLHKGVVGSAKLTVHRTNRKVFLMPLSTSLNNKVYPAGQGLLLHSVMTVDVGCSRHGLAIANFSIFPTWGSTDSPSGRFPGFSSLLPCKQIYSYSELCAPLLLSLGMGVCLLL